MAKIVVKDTTIRTMSKNGIDFFCITDIAKQKNSAEPKDAVKNRMRVKNTLEYLGLWESLNNPDFNGVEFDPIMREAGSNSFTMSPSRWIELTNAIGIINKLGREGGTYAQRDIAFKFASWVSVEFELYLVKEFQRLKEEEQKLIGWSAKRELSKINYRIHTDATSERGGRAECGDVRHDGKTMARSQCRQFLKAKKSVKSTLVTSVSLSWIPLLSEFQVNQRQLPL